MQLQPSQILFLFSLFFPLFLYYSGTLSDISPIKGFKWGNDWTLMSEEGVTDAEG